MFNITAYTVENEVEIHSVENFESALLLVKGLFTTYKIKEWNIFYSKDDTFETVLTNKTLPIIQNFPQVELVEDDDIIFNNTETHV